MPIQPTNTEASQKKDPMRAFAYEIMKFREKMQSGEITKENAPAIMKQVCDKHGVSVEQGTMLAQKMSQLNQTLAPVMQKDPETGTSRLGRYLGDSSGAGQTAGDIMGQAQPASTGGWGVDNFLAEYKTPILMGLSALGASASRKAPASYDAGGKMARAIQAGQQTATQRMALQAENERAKQATLDKANEQKVKMYKKLENGDIESIEVPASQVAEAGAMGYSPGELNRAPKDTLQEFDIFANELRRQGVPDDQIVKQYKNLKDGSADNVAVENYKKSVLQNMYKRYERRTDMMGKMEQLKPGASIDRAINWTRSRMALKDKYITAEDINPVEIDMFSEIMLPRVIIDDIAIMRQSGASDEKILQLLMRLRKEIK